MKRSLLLQILLVLVVGAAAFTAGLLTTPDRGDAKERLERVRDDADTVERERDELQRTADQLTKKIGLEVELGKPTTTLDDVENFGDRDFFEDARVTPFGMVGLVEGVAFKVISVKPVESGKRKHTDDEAHERLPDIKPTRDDIRLVRIDLDVINRSGGVDDPACGMVASDGGFEQARVLMVDEDEINRGVEAGLAAETYQTACNRGLPDGARGRIAVYWGVLGDGEGARIVALDPGFTGNTETNPIAGATQRNYGSIIEDSDETPTSLLLALPKPA